MAIYHLHAQTIGRGSGKSAVAAAAYRSTERLTDRETGIICDYTRKTKALDSRILAPEGAPEWVFNREKLWNEVQTKENRKNSQFAWEYDIALPFEFRNSLIINDFCRENFINKGLICDYAVHGPDKKGDNRNYHAHIMVTTRTMTAEGWGEKHRVGENKISDRKEWLNEIRKSWEVICNQRLEQTGSKERIDCRTLEAQGIDRLPQQHQGHRATAMERKGKKPERTREREKEEELPEETSKVLKVLEHEEKLIVERIRLANLNDDDFKKESKSLEAGQIKAMALATKELLSEIERANKLEGENLDKRAQELKKQKPHGIDEKPNAIKKIFLEWSTSDGKSFKKYDDYAEHQQSLINKFLTKAAPVVEAQKILAAEKKMIKDTKTSKGIEATSLALKLSRRQEQQRPALFVRIKEKANELLDKAVEFSGYRNFKNAIKEVREARAESAIQKKQERTQMTQSELRRRMSR